MQEQELRKELKVVEKKTTGLVISGAEDYRLAGKAVLDLDGMIKKVKDYWRDPKEKAFQAHKAITAKETEMLKPLADRRNALARMMSVYATEQARIKAEEQRRIDEERRAAEDAEKKRLESAAKRAEAKGNTDKAEELRSQADEVFVPAMVVEGPVAKTEKTDAGAITQTVDIVVSIIDVKAVLSLVISGKLPESIVKIDSVRLKSIIKLNAWEALDGCTIEKVINAKFRRA